MYKIILNKPILFYPDPEIAGDERKRIHYNTGDSFIFNSCYLARLSPHGEVIKVDENKEMDTNTQQLETQEVEKKEKKSIPQKPRTRATRKKEL